MVDKKAHVVFHATDLTWIENTCFSIQYIKHKGQYFMLYMVSFDEGCFIELLKVVCEDCQITGNTSILYKVLYV